MFRNLKNNKTRSKSGQSTVEYIVLASAVLAVIILFAAAPGGGLQGKMSNILNTSSEGMGTASDKLDESHSSLDRVVVNGSSIMVDPTANLITGGN